MSKKKISLSLKNICKNRSSLRKLVKSLVELSDIVGMRNKLTLIEKIEKFGIQHNFLKQNSRILIGLSGGSDSVCLTLLLKEMQEKYSLCLMAAHVNYHLRGVESDLDEVYVKKLCIKENIPLYIKHSKINNSGSLQQKAREIRFEYFFKLKKYYKLDFIALGHHYDDQVETVMHRFIRGSGFSGLSGISPNCDNIIHPILAIKKIEILEYLANRNIDFCTDKTNNQNKYTRNKIRNELLPQICQSLNSNFEQKLIEYSNLFYMSNIFFVEHSKKYFKKALVSLTESDIVFNNKYLSDCFPILLYYIFKRALKILSGSDKNFYNAHFQKIMSLMETKNGFKKLTLPCKIMVMKDYENIIFRRVDNYNPKIYEVKKEITQVRNVFSFNDHRYKMQKIKQLPETGLGDGVNNVVIDLDKIVFPIILRYRAIGDKFIPFGRKSLKKLKDYFIDEKIDLQERDKTVLFTDVEKIFWVSGYRLDQRVAVTDETKNYLLVSMINEDSHEPKNRSAYRKVRQ